MKKVWHKSLNFDLSPYKRDTEEGARLRWQRAQRWLLHLPSHSLGGFLLWSPWEPKGICSFKAFERVQKCQKRVWKIRNTNPSPANNWNIPVARVLNSDLGPAAPKVLENRDVVTTLCGWEMASGLQSRSNYNIWSSELCVKADVPLSKRNAKPPFNSQIAKQPRFAPNKFDENSQELQESFSSNMVQLRDGNKTMVRETSVPPFGLVQSLHEFYHG